MSARRRVSSSTLVFSSAAVKCALHTMIEWVMAPSAMRCTMSQVDSGTQRCTSETTMAATNHSTTT